MKYIFWKLACLAVFVTYVLWLYNQLRFDEPELRVEENLFSIFWAVVTITCAVFVVALGVFNKEAWPLIALGAGSLVLTFQEFWALKSDDSWRMTYLCLIGIGLALLVLPVDRFVLSELKKHRERKKGGPSEPGPRPSTPPPATAASPGISVGGFGRQD